MNDAEKNKDLTSSTKNKPKPALNFLLLSAGSVFTSMIVAGFIVGFAIDWFLETTPIFMLLCGVLGFVGGSMKVQELLKKMDLMDSAYLSEQEKKELKQKTELKKEK